MKGPFHYRLERAGYNPAEGDIPYKSPRVFEHDEMTIGLEPSSWTPPGDARAPIPGRPRDPKIFITNAKLSALPAGADYIVVSEMDLSRRWYGNYAGLLDDLALEARNIGADAIFELEKHYHVSTFAWAVPEVRGKAIIIKDPCILAGIGGAIYPREEADTPQNKPISERCAEGAPAAGEPSAAASKGSGCSVQQILSMKRSGLTDDQVKAACGK